MATKKNLTLSQHEGQPHLKPYCQAAKEAAERKTIADELRAKATVELRAKLDSDPETKDFTGTVVPATGETNAFKTPNSKSIRHL